MSIFYNIRAQFVEDVPYLIQLTATHKPRWALVMDGVELAAQLKAASPNTNVIYRAWPDDRVQMSPKDWLEKKKGELKGYPLWAYTYNEIGIQTDWHIKLIEESVKQGWPVNLVIGNMSVGTPAPSEWEEAKNLELLRLLDLHRDHVVLGLHEYGHGVIVSGFQDKHFELNQAAWPTSVDENKNNWHCGRYKFLVQTCRKFGINPPRIVITEHGFDSLGDMKERLPGGGWHTLVPFWGEWFKGVSPEEVYAMQLDYADRIIYSYGGDIVEGQLIFQYGGKESGLWNAFDVEKSRTLHTLLASRESSDVPPVITPPITPEKVVISAADKNIPVRFRRDPSTGDNSSILGYVQDPVEAFRFTGEIVVNNGWTFQKFSINGQIGWAAIELLLIKSPEEASNISMTISEFVDIKTRMNNLKSGIAVLNVQADELDKIISSLQ